MPTERQSFLSNLIGQEFYKDSLKYARPIALYGTGILALLIILSGFVYVNFLKTLLGLFSGASILFIIYIGAVILTLDKRVEVEVPEHFTHPSNQMPKKPCSYNFTKIWGCILLICGILAIYGTNRYRKFYAQQCETFLLDREAGIYHLNFDNDCEGADNATYLEKIKGHELEHTPFTPCDYCLEWAEDAEMEYHFNQYRH